MLWIRCCVDVGRVVLCQVSNAVTVVLVCSAGFYGARGSFW